MWVTESVKVLKRNVDIELEVLFPALIIAIIKAQPVSLPSNIQFICRYRLCDVFDDRIRMNEGEEQDYDLQQELFCLTQFILAVSFLMKASYQDFSKIDKELWSSLMGRNSQ